MAIAQETQERHANRCRQPAEAFKVEDRVYLRLKNVRTKQPCKKLDWIALSYRVQQLVGSHAVKLDTPRGIHPVFHVNLIRRGGDPLPSQILQNTEPPAIDPDNADEDHAEGEYIVEKLLDHRNRLGGRHRIYEVRFDFLVGTLLGSVGFWVIGGG